MRILPAVLFAALACTTTAATLFTLTDCSGSWCQSRNSKFRNDYGSFNVDASEGCRSTTVPGVTRLCMDWRHRRGHFRYSNETSSRCLQPGSGTPKEDYPCFGGHKCSELEFLEVPCSW
ncbi:hypothetical protein PWT90_05883 [Aphanocladium album]|nr:hypothetical protein PWT90_05883 [Aphanocladium album]